MYRSLNEIKVVFRLRVSLCKVLALRISYLLAEEGAAHDLLGRVLLSDLCMHALLDHVAVHLYHLLFLLLFDGLLIKALKLHHGAAHGLPAQCFVLTLLHFKYLYLL